MQNMSHNHNGAMRKLFGPEHFTTAEVVTAGFLSLKHSTSSCGLLLGFGWRTELYKSKAGISLKIWMFNDIVM